MAYLVKNGAILTISGDPIVAPTSGDSSVNNRPVQTVTPTESQQIVSYSSPYTGLEGVIVQAIPSQYIIPTGTKFITSNGTDIDVTEYATVDVAVPIGSTINNKPSQTIVPTESQQTIGYSSPYTGLEEVIVDAISSTYVGSGISRKSSTDLIVSGATITAPAGYYESSASESVLTMILPTAASSSATSGYTSKTTISRSTSDQYINIPPGYNSAGGYYKISAVANGSVTAPATISGTSAALSTGTGTLTLTKTVSVTPSVTTAGYISSGTVGNSEISLTASVTINPTPTANGATVTIPAGYYSSQTTKSVSTMTLPTAASATSSGTSKATISRSTSNQYINIPVGYNDTAAYYTISAVANGSATGPTSITQSSATVSTGTNTLTLTKQNVTTTPTVSAGYVSSATASTATVSLTASVTTKAAATYYPSTSDQTISASQYLTGAQTIKAVTTTNLIAANIKKNVVIEVGDTNDSDRILSITGSYEGSGSGNNLQVETATTTPSSASSSISFTGLSGEPTSFVVTSMSDLATGSSPWKTASVVYDGTDVIGQVITNTSNAQVTYDSSGFSKNYSNGTLTITGTSTNFQANQYKLVYTYGGSSGNIGTDDVQVGSGATSITFTGLSDEPSYFSCIFKSNFSASSGYQRVITVVYDGTSTYGLAMDSGANADTNWSYTYNNGSLIISSSGTNAGGYFHQPGYYQLTYATGEVIELTTEPVEFTSNGIYTAPKGKAYTPVTVNVSGGGGANFDTVTTTNSSNQNTSISFTLPSGRTPKAFFARLTSQIARSSNSRYYYVYDMRWDGTSNGGVAGNTFYMSSGTLTNVTSGYSYSQSGTTFTLSSTGSRSASPGSFYNGTYEMVYVY